MQRRNCKNLQRTFRSRTGGVLPSFFQGATHLRLYRLRRRKSVQLFSAADAKEFSISSSSQNGRFVSRGKSGEWQESPETLDEIVSRAPPKTVSAICPRVQMEKNPLLVRHDDIGLFVIVQIHRRHLSAHAGMVINQVRRETRRPVRAAFEFKPIQHRRRVRFQIHPTITVDVARAGLP